MEAGTLRSVKDRLCAQCYAKASLKCGKCKIPWYCSNECQAKDWQLGHKGDCGLADLPPPVIEKPPPRLLVESVECPVVSGAAWRRIVEGAEQRARQRLLSPRPPRGLLNIGNTCYMNSALQGLYHAAPQLGAALREHRKSARTCTLDNCFRCALEDLWGDCLDPVPDGELGENGSEPNLGIGDIVTLRDLSRDDLNGQEGIVHSAAPQGSPDDESRRCGVRLQGSMAMKAIRPANLSLRCRAPVGPRQVARWIPRLSSEFNFGAQEDAHEFLRSVLRLVEDEELQEHSRALKSSGSQQLPEPHADLTTTPNLTFRGLLVSTCTCTNRACAHCSASFESFMDLSLDITEATDSLEDCLRLFVAPERLDKKNGWTCEKCGEKVRARKQLTIYQAPSVLVIQLKRFRAVMGGADRGKVTKPITFKADLNLRPYICTASPEGSRPNLYELSAVVVHVDKAGFSHFGHYVAFVRVPAGGGISRWYLLDDSQVTEVSEADVLRQQAYILLYSASSPKANGEASHSAGAAGGRKPSKEDLRRQGSANGAGVGTTARCRGRAGATCTFFAASDGLCYRCYQDEHGCSPPPPPTTEEAPAPPASFTPQDRGRGPAAGTTSARPSPAAAAAASNGKPKKVGANDQCPCGSGKKYKKCHGAA